jgi:hypothetical protein
MIQTRRQLLTTAALASAAGLVLPARPLAADRALETTSVRLQKSAALYIAPVYVVEGLLRAATRLVAE